MPDVAGLVPRPWITARLDRWLRTEDTRIFLVTGPPGTGKTVFAARLAAPEDEHDAPGGGGTRPGRPDVVLAHFCDASDERTLDALDFVRALSGALARRIPRFADALAASAAGAAAVITINSTQTIGTVEAGARVANVQIRVSGSVPTRQAFAHLVRRPLEAAVADGWDERLLVVVDDLSAGYRYDSEDTIAHLIGVVAGNPAELPDVLRFVVTGRPDPWVLRDLPPPALDLRADRPPGEDDIRRYVRRRLPAAGAAWRLWADRIVAAADGNFLYARHVVERLPAGGEVPPDPPADLPEGLTGLYRAWFRADIARSRDLWWDLYEPVLAALTVARGAGLTHEQLCGITGLPRSRVRRVLEECAQFLLGAPRSGPVRLYHDSFRDYLAEEEVQVEEAHHAVLRYFVRRHGDDWLGAAEYACDHLATHAAAIGELVVLVNRPDFLVAAEPGGVLRALSRPGVTGRYAEVYRRAGRLLADRDRGERASYLQMAAYELGEAEAAEAFAGLPPERRWTPLWASMLRHHPGRVVGAHPGGVLAMLWFPRPDGTTVVTAGPDGTVRFWDLRTHTVLGVLKLPSATPAARLALLGTGDEAVLAVAALHQVWLADPERMEVTGSVAARPGSPVTAMSPTVLEDRAVVVLGYADGVVQAVDPFTGEPVTEPVPAHEGPVLSLTGGFDDGVLSCGADGAVILWGLRGEIDRQPVIRPPDLPAWCGASAFLSGDTGRFALAAGYSDGMTDLIVVGDHDSEIRTGIGGHEPAAWQLDTAFLSEGLLWQSRMHRRGRNGYADALREVRELHLRGLNPDDGPPESRQIVLLSGGVTSVDLLEVDGRLHLATGGQDGKVSLVGRPDEDEPAVESLLPWGEPVSSVMFSELDGGLVLVSGESAVGGMIREWPLRSGADLLPPPVGELAAPAIDVDALADESGRLVVAAVLADGSVVLREEGRTRPLETGELITAGVRLWRWRHRTCVAVYGQRGPEAALRLWTPGSSGETVVTDVRLGRPGAVHEVTVVGDGGRLLAAGDWEEPVLWTLTADEDRWGGDPLPVPGVHPLAVGTSNVVQWMTPVAGSQGHEVFVGGVALVHHLSAQGQRITGHLLVVQTNAVSILHEGGRALVVGAGPSVRVENLDDDEASTNLDAPPDSEVLAVAALEDGSLLAAGTGDGRLLVWRGQDHPEHVVQFGSPIRQIAVPTPGVAVVRTDMGLQAVRFSHS
ncbi:WD40 repeat domain-containing protein [Microbispora sp. H10670]|uniref:WD40 repeat domain-containing protein n=1 Tax=Microbispora sp. H10670 TaxID=2729108 RepID=UPI001603F3AA|nr:WD40 repeat domain-containing protein [Microbispora sp. H10670]